MRRMSAKEPLIHCISWCGPSIIFITDNERFFIRHLKIFFQEIKCSQKCWRPTMKSNTLCNDKSKWLLLYGNSSFWWTPHNTRNCIVHFRIHWWQVCMGQNKSENETDPQHQNIAELDYIDYLPQKFFF